jgi:hypothetical protein
VVELVKPWASLEGYIKTRSAEARCEAELARRFLEEGLVRNAAGKAWQAWKAVLAGLAAKSLDLLEGAFPGVRRTRDGRALKEAYWIAALMPTTRVRSVAQLLAGRYGEEVLYYTLIALDLHEFQYNGPDREGIFSRYRTEEEARRDVERLVAAVEKYLSALQ